MKKQFVVLTIFLLIFINIQIDQSSSNTSVFTVENERTFWILDTWKSYNNIDDDNDGIIDFNGNDWDEGIYQIETTLILSTANFTVYLDDLISIDQNQITLSINELETKIELITNTFGEIPDVNNDKTITVIITDIRDENYYTTSQEFVQGFFWPTQSVTYGSGIQQYSHYEEIIYLDKDIIPVGDMTSIFVHELQHLIQFSYHRNQELWLDEAMSVYAQYICGYYSDVKIYGDYLFNNPNLSLTYFEGKIESYGYGYLFLRYLASNYGSEIVSLITENNNIGILGITNVIENKIGILYSSVEIINNFSLALTLNSPLSNSLNIPGYSQTIDATTITIEDEIIQSIPSWGFNSYKLQDGEYNSIKYDFNNDRLDSNNNGVSYWITVISINGTSKQIWSHFIDPLSGKAEGLWNIQQINDGTTYIIINSYSGISSGSTSGLPPSSEYELTMTTHEGSFLFPGYIHVKDNHMFVSSIRIYDSLQEEWNQKNTIISKFELINTNTNAISKEGVLQYVPSGWLINDVDLNDLPKSDLYKIKYTFYDGNETITLFSDEFSIKDSGNPNLSIEPIIKLIQPLTLLVLFVFVVYSIRRVIRSRESEYGPTKLSKLKPMFLNNKDKTNSTIPVKFKRRRGIK